MKTIGHPTSPMPGPELFTVTIRQIFKFVLLTVVKMLPQLEFFIENIDEQRDGRTLQSGL